MKGLFHCHLNPITQSLWFSENLGPMSMSLLPLCDFTKYLPAKLLNTPMNTPIFKSNVDPVIRVHPALEE